MGKVVYWEMATTRAIELVDEIAEGDLKKLARKASPMKYFREMQQEHILYAFHEFKKEMHPSMVKTEAPYLENSARRLAFR